MRARTRTHTRIHIRHVLAEIWVGTEDGWSVLKGDSQIPGPKWNNSSVAHVSLSIGC